MQSSQPSKRIFLYNTDADQQVPLVILISWSNAKKSQLLKYSQIYEEEGYSTMLVLCKLIRLTLFHKSLFQEDTKNAINVIQEQIRLNSNRKIIFHLFSAPGPAMFINIMDYFYQYLPRKLVMNKFNVTPDEIIPNIVGVIYDSCVIALLSSKEWGDGVEGSIQNPLLRRVCKYAGRVFYRMSSRNPVLTTWDSANRDIPGGYAQLFLSSKSDYLLNHDKVINFVDYRKENSEDIRYHIWEDSEHVLHFRKYPHEYRKLVTTFCKNITNVKPVYEIFF